MPDAVELSVITGILKLRDLRRTDFAEFGADNVLEAVDAYLAGALGWNDDLIARFEELLANSNIDADLLQACWSRLRATGGHYVPETTRPLIKQFHDYRDVNPGTMAWPYSHSESYDFANSLNGTFDFATDANLSIRAYGRPPEAVENLLGADKATLAVNIEGSASAAAGVSWPFDLGSAAAGGAASVGLTTTSYFKHEPGRLIGAALVEDLRGISVPFARNYIVDQFMAIPSLVLSVYTTRGSAELNASLGVTAPLSAGPVVGASLKVLAAYRITGNFETRVARLANGDINIKIDHKRAIDRSAGIELGVSLSAARILLPVHEALSQGLGEIRELMDALQTEWIFQEQFPGTIRDALGGVAEDPLWTEFIEMLLTPGDGDSFADTLKIRMKNSLAGVSRTWRDRFARAARDLVAEKINSVDQDRRMALERFVGFENLESALSANILQQADELTSEFLQLAVNHASVLVERLIRTNNLAIFHPVVQRLQEVDRRVGVVRMKVGILLGDYATKVQLVEGTVKALVENQVETKIRDIRSSSRGTSILADVEISRNMAARHADAIDRLLAGRPDEITKLAMQHNSGVRINESVLAHYLQKERTLGFGVAVLDLKLDRKSILSNDVEVVRDDLTGTITVGTRASIRKSQNLLGDERSIQLVSVAQLSSARDTGVGGLSAVFNRSEEKLTNRELDAFLQGFEDAGLISHGQHEAAMAAAFAASGVTLDIIEDAEVVAGIAWNDTQLSRLFSADEPLDYNDVFGATVTAVELLAVFDENDFERVNQLLGENPRLSTAGELLLFGSSSRCRHLKNSNRVTGPHRNRPGAASRRRNFNLLAKIENWSRNITGLHKSLLLMADVYHSGDDGWTGEDYVEAQNRINEKLSRWIKLPSLLSSLFARFPWAADSDDRVKENTLALLAVLEALTAGDNDESALRIELRYKQGTAQKTQRLV